MMKLKNKELIVCIITVIALMLVLATNVFATVPSLNELQNAVGEENELSNEFVTINNAQVSLNEYASINSTNTNTNANNTNTTTIPATGVDYSVIFIIAICGISAIYAYKKIRDYKNV